MGLLLAEGFPAALRTQAYACDTGGGREVRGAGRAPPICQPYDSLARPRAQLTLWFPRNRQNHIVYTFMDVELSKRRSSYAYGHADSSGCNAGKP